MRPSRNRRIFAFVALSYLASVVLVHGQAGKAELTGKVRDQNGAFV